MDMASIDSDLIRGHIDTIILKSLFESDKYGLEIIQEIEEKSNGSYELKQPTLYSCLKRLENQGLISSYWEDSEIGGKRHYYTLTDLGRTTYKSNQEEWLRSKEIIDTLIYNNSSVNLDESLDKNSNENDDGFENVNENLGDETLNTDIQVIDRLNEENSFESFKSSEDNSSENLDENSDEYLNNNSNENEDSFDIVKKNPDENINFNNLSEKELDNNLNSTNPQFSDDLDSTMAEPITFDIQHEETENLLSLSDKTDANRSENAQSENYFDNQFVSFDEIESTAFNNFFDAKQETASDDEFMDEDDETSLTAPLSYDADNVVSQDEQPEMFSINILNEETTLAEDENVHDNLQSAQSFDEEVTDENKLINNNNEVEIETHHNELGEASVYNLSDVENFDNDTEDEQYELGETEYLENDEDDLDKADEYTLLHEDIEDGSDENIDSVEDGDNVQLFIDNVEDGDNAKLFIDGVEDGDNVELSEDENSYQTISDEFVSNNDEAAADEENSYNDEIYRLDTDGETSNVSSDDEIYELDTDEIYNSSSDNEIYKLDNDNEIYNFSNEDNKEASDFQSINSDDADNSAYSWENSSDEEAEFDYINNNDIEQNFDDDIYLATNNNDSSHYSIDANSEEKDNSNDNNWDSLYQDNQVDNLEDEKTDNSEVSSPTYINFDSHSYDEVDITNSTANVENEDDLSAAHLDNADDISEMPKQNSYQRASQEEIESLYKTTENYEHLQAGYTDETYKQMLNELESYGSNVSEESQSEKHASKTFDELQADFEKDGIEVRKHQKQVKENNDSKIYIKTNQIHMIKNWITFGITTFALLLTFLIMNSFKENFTYNFQFWHFAAAIGISLIIPLWSTLLYVINPYKKVVAKYAPRLNILLSVLINIQLILIIYCLNLQLGFYSFSQENYNHLLWILPLILSFIPTIQSLVYYPLYSSKNYHV